MKNITAHTRQLRSRISACHKIINVAIVTVEPCCLMSIPNICDTFISGRQNKGTQIHCPQIAVRFLRFGVALSHFYFPGTISTLQQNVSLKANSGFSTPRDIFRPKYRRFLHHVIR